jgi:hypothetical protein
MLMATRATQDITTQDITRKYYSWSILHASEEEETTRIAPSKL